MVAGEEIDIDRILAAEKRARAEEVLTEIGRANLTGALEKLGEGWDYGMLKIYIEYTRRE
jgi:hypothetical protein